MLPGRDFNVRDILVLSHGCKESISPVHIKLTASAGLQIGKGHRQICGINAELSVFTVSHII